MKKLVLLPLTLFLVFFLHKCHGGSIFKNLPEEEEEMKELFNEFRNDKEINLGTLEKFLNDITHDKLRMLKRAIEEEHMIHRAVKNKYKKPKRLIINSNCDTECVKTKCYAVLMGMDKGAQEKRYKCKVKCGDECRYFLKHAYQCYKDVLNGDCSHKQGDDDNIKLACHDKIPRCLIKRLKEDELNDIQNDLKLNINDPQADKPFETILEKKEKSGRFQ